jgi:hypothetical protein
VAHRPAATLSNVKGKRDAPSLPANVTCLHSTQTKSFRADHVRFRNAGGAVVQVLMRSDLSQPKHSFETNGRHLLEQRQGPGGFRVVAPRIMSSGTQYCSAIESNTTRPIERFGDIVAYPMLGGLHHRYARI